jgi:ribonucleases P/MRP protein subunit RPP40
VKARYRMFDWGVCFWRVNLTTAVIEIELRKPSMLHGKKGFERLVYAAKNVLNQSMVWLFCDLNPNKDPEGSSAIGKHHPTIMEGNPTDSNFQHVLTPPFSQVFSDFNATTVPDTINAEAAYEIIEWLGLVVLRSPRVLHDDNIDSYLSRYVVPEGSIQVSSVRIINWQGLIGAKWVTEMLNRCM